MTSAVLAVDSYRFHKSDAFLLDANVWLSIYHPQVSSRPRGPVYSRALREMRRAGSTLFVDVLVLSEFINRYARLEHGVAVRRGAPSDFKRFRRTRGYRGVATAVADAVRRLLASCGRARTPFESLDLGAVLATYETQAADFNDLILAQLCKDNGLKLVTHDADFAGAGVTILTANQRLLR